MSDRFEGRTALVTGAASGLGAETARRFVADGGSVIIADLQKDAGIAMVEELGDAARFMSVDVTQEAQVSAAVDYAVTEFGALDVMINNAGVVGAIGSIVDTSVKEFDQTMAVLLRGVFLGMKHAARVMIPQRSGVILSLSSVAGVVGGLGPHIYSGAKRAVIGLTESVGSELTQYGIRVNAVAPGSIVSPMTADVGTGDPSDLAETAKGIAEGSHRWDLPACRRISPRLCFIWPAMRPNMSVATRWWSMPA